MSSEPMWKEAASRALGSHLFDYLQGRPVDMPAAAIDPNEAALMRYRLVPRVLMGHPAIDMSTMLLGRRYAAPIGVGAFAADKLFHEGGVTAIGRVCARLNLPLFVSEEANTPWREVVDSGADCWLQIRGAGPVSRAISLAEAALTAGAYGIVLTVLAPAHPTPGMRPGGVDVAAEIATRGWSTIGASEGVAPLPALPAWGLAEVSALADAVHRKSGKLMVKGVLHPDDAVRVTQAGADAVLVSNIGVRQTYRWVPSIECVKEVGRALSGRPDIAVVFDGGIRHASDAIVARVLGAHMSMLVRPVAYALAADGEHGVETFLTRFIGEMSALCVWLGVADLSQLNVDHVMHV
jgi:isopentenyl diphosphate isomerase/L-lactate dehydrogenase-like FMN-dependent dehydrogenase